ncbi:MAG TPA: energy transducer TonB [Vicinamibacteria bacterium]|nr:energy transducer TonB [Vicinamibacteria bacterium]
MLPAAALLVALAQAPPASAPPEEEPRCEWSPVFARLTFPPFDPSARLVPPRRVKGQVKWPKARQRHEIEGRWVAQVVVDARGRTVDARMIERPRVTPPWPEFEASVLKDVRRMKWRPATADGVPVPVCMDLPVFSTPLRGSSPRDDAGLR